jgi:hypothetical protein
MRARAFPFPLQPMLFVEAQRRLTPASATRSTRQQTECFKNQDTHFVFECAVLTYGPEPALIHTT